MLIFYSAILGFLYSVIVIKETAIRIGVQYSADQFNPISSVKTTFNEYYLEYDTEMYSTERSPNKPRTEINAGFYKYEYTRNEQQSQ